MASNWSLLAFHDELDFVGVHDGLVEEFRSVLITNRVRQSLESQIEAIVRSKGIYLVERTAFLRVSIFDNYHDQFRDLKLSSSQIFKDLLRQLLQGKALSIEDTVDLLTLKDNGESLEDYATSFQLLNYAKVGYIWLKFSFNVDDFLEFTRGKEEIRHYNRLEKDLSP